MVVQEALLREGGEGRGGEGRGGRGIIKVEMGQCVQASYHWFASCYYYPLLRSMEKLDSIMFTTLNTHTPKIFALQRTEACRNITQRLVALFKYNTH